MSDSNGHLIVNGGTVNGMIIFNGRTVQGHLIVNCGIVKISVEQLVD